MCLKYTYYTYKYCYYIIIHTHLYDIYLYSYLSVYLSIMYPFDLMSFRHMQKGIITT